MLTSTHGLRGEQRDGEIHRCLLLNGAYDAPKVTAIQQLRAQEIHNNRTLLETIAAFEPEIVHVFSLHGLSKSLIFTLRNARVPVAYAVFDHWLCGRCRRKTPGCATGTRPRCRSSNNRAAPPWK